MKRPLQLTRPTIRRPIDWKYVALWAASWLALGFLIALLWSR